MEVFAGVAFEYLGISTWETSRRRATHHLHTEPHDGNAVRDVIGGSELLTDWRAGGYSAVSAAAPNCNVFDDPGGMSTPWCG